MPCPRVSLKRLTCNWVSKPSCSGTRSWKQRWNLSLRMLVSAFFSAALSLQITRSGQRRLPSQSCSWPPCRLHWTTLRLNSRMCHGKPTVTKATNWFSPCKKKWRHAQLCSQRLPWETKTDEVQSAQIAVVSLNDLFVQLEYRKHSMDPWAERRLDLWKKKSRFKNDPVAKKKSASPPCACKFLNRYISLLRNQQ